MINYFSKSTYNFFFVLGPYLLVLLRGLLLMLGVASVNTQGLKREGSNLGLPHVKLV